MIVLASSPADLFAGTPTADDLDGDGIPNAWETAHIHNPNDPEDADSDFDMDGLFALQEYQLNLSSGGTAGKPEGKWRATALPTPPGFQTISATTLIECADKGTILAQVNGRLMGSSVTTKRPYTWSPMTNQWTRVAPPSGYESVTDLQGLDVNSSGQVVGFFNYGGTKGFIWNPDGNGSSSLFYLNTSSGAKAAIPKRIGDFGYITGNLVTYPSSSFAGTTNGLKIEFSDLPGHAIFFDVTGFGEFIGNVSDPVTGQSQVFLANAGLETFFTGITQAYFTGISGAWGSVPEIDTTATVWTEASEFESWSQFGTAVDRQNGEVVELRESGSGSIYWRSHENYGEEIPIWYDFPSFTSLPGAVNRWGEFAGSLSS